MFKHVKHREITDYTPNGHIVIKSLVVRLLWWVQLHVPMFAAVYLARKFMLAYF